MELYNARQCRRCEYGMLASVEDGYICDYLSQVGEMRNGDTWPTCEKFKARTKKKKASLTTAKKKKAKSQSKGIRNSSALTEFDLKVLTAYGDNDRSVAKTMRAMNMREHTIRWRLRKAERITGYNPKVKEELDMILKGEKKV